MIDDDILKVVKRADVIFASHSGGKDSQAMLAKLVRLGLKNKIVIVHADLGEMEWETMHTWIEKNAFGLPVNVVKSETNFFDMVRKYHRIPSGQHQFCTDFLKLKPIESFIHDYMQKHGYKTAINCTGIRAEESARRAKKPMLDISTMTRKRKFPDHLIYDFLPILHYKIDDVKKEIFDAGQEMHKIYSMGFSRLSCVFCVNGRKSEHELAAKLRPKLARKIADLEREIGKTYRLKQKNKIKMNYYMSEYLTLCD